MDTALKERRQNAECSRIKGKDRNEYAENVAYRFLIAGQLSHLQYEMEHPAVGTSSRPPNLWFLFA